MSASTNEITTSEAVKTSGTAKTKPPSSSLHGIDYQLKITLWNILIAKHNISNHKYSKCSITAEDPLGGKFDDTVMHFQLPDGSNQALYIQAKHKLDTEYQISIADLTSTSDSAFSVIKYFKSFCKLHSQGKTDGAWFVLCTNAGVSENVGQRGVLHNDMDSLTDDITAIFSRVKDTKVYQLHKERICNIEPLKIFFASSTIDNGLLDQFFRQFLLVTNMKGIEINADIFKLWCEMGVPSSSLVAPQMRLIEQAISLDHLSSVEWTMSKSSETKPETDIDRISEAILRKLCFLKLKGTTRSYCENFENSVVKIKSEALKQSKAYRACTTAGVHEYCAMLDIKMSCNIIFQIVQLIECEYIFIDSQTYLELAGVIRDIFCFLECNMVLVIVCDKDTTIITRSDEELFKGSIIRFKKSKVTKSVIFITPSEEQNNEEEFIRVSDLTKITKQRIFKNYSQMKICYAHVSLENLINQEDNLAFVVGLIKTAESENFKTHPSIESFEKIKTLYIDRSWKISTVVDRDNYSRSSRYLWMDESLLQPLRYLQEHFEFEKIYRWMRSQFEDFLVDTYHVIQQPVEKGYTPPPGMDTSDRVIIILEEAGIGKTAYMTFVAWYFVIHRQSSWVIRLNAIEYSLDFEQILKDHDPVLDDNKAIRILFQLIYLALSTSNRITKTWRETDAERKKAERWAECLTLSEGKVVVNCTRDATIEQQIALRVFREKLNKKRIVLLLDGFDEIVPHYKQVVLNLFSRFAQFKGIHKLYFTSRPYKFIDELKDAFQVTNTYRIEPFSNENQNEFLHRYLKCNFDGYESAIIDNSLQFSYLREILLIILGNILGELHSIPLFFRMALDILTPRFMETINFIECTVSPTLFQEVHSMYGRSRVLEAFVNQKLAIANDKKFLSSDSAYATPQARLDAEELNELKKNDLSLLSIYTIIPSKYQLLTTEEQQKCKQLITKIKDGREKSGIVEGVQGGVPLFIHRMFTEYFAAHWLFKNRDRHKVQMYYKSKSFWDIQNIEVRKMFDEIAIRDNDGNDSPVHLTILRKDKIRLKNALTNNVHEQTDAIGRTPLHMAVQYFDDMRFGEEGKLEEVFLEVMNNPHSHLLIHAKDNLLHWSALDYAFRVGNREAINYLLKFDASINVTVLSEQLPEHDPKDACETLALYDKYLMDIAHGIDEYKPRSTHSTKQIKTMGTVCNNVVTHMKNNHSAWFEEFQTDRLLMCAKRDSVLLLRSLLSSKTDLASNQASIITKALNERSFHILGFFIHELKIDISGMIDANNVYDLLEYCIDKGYKKWFACILNLYSSALNIAGRTHWDACDPGKLKLLFFAITYGSLEQVQHLIDGLLLTIDVGFVFAFLNQVTSEMYKHYYSCTDGLRCVLDRIENLYDSDEEGRNLLHRSAQLGLFGVVKWLIENKQFDPTTVNPLNNWNAFHYCVSIPCNEHPYMYGSGCLESFEYMMQTKPINVNDAEGKKVFYLAVVTKHFSIAQHILDMALVATSSEQRSAQQRSYIESLNVGGSMCTEFLEFIQEISNK